MNSQGPRRNTRRNVRRRTRSVRPVVVVQAPGTGRRRRNGRRPARRRANNLSRPTGRTEVFTFSVNDIKGNSSGVIKFGPSLSQCPALSDGILKSYHDYAITNVQVFYRSHASSETEGALFIELDNSCTQSALGSYINSFTITSSGSKTFTAGSINGTTMKNYLSDQFYLLYKGNSSKATVAGQFIITIRVKMANPK
nr:putative coat protein [Barley yellow dwarf virus]